MVKRLSFGISAAALVVTVVTVLLIAPRQTPPPVAQVAEAAPVKQVTQEVGREQEMNEYWLGRINALREEAHLHPLVLSTSLMANATEWATWMGTNATLTHDRPDGTSIQRRGYVENIGRAYADETTESL